MKKFCLVLVSKKKHQKKYQVSKRFFYKKQFFINWFIQTQFLSTIKRLSRVT